MPNQLPVSRIVNVSVNLAPLAAQSQSLSNLLLLGASAIIDTVERYREYKTIEAVALDFGTTAPEYLAAVAWFAQRPQPTALLIARWYQAAARGGLRCAPLPAASQVMSTWNAITAGSFAIQKDGAVAVNVTAMNFSSATTMQGIAAIIQAGTGMPAGVTVVWNSTYQRFELESTTTGTTSAISFLTAAGVGTDISTTMAGRSTSSGAYVYAGAISETALAGLQAIDNMIGQKFYGVSVLGLVPGVSADNTQLTNIAAYIEAAGNKRAFGITTQEAAALLATSTTDLPYVLKAAKYLRTFIQYSSTSAYAVMSAMARLLSVDYEASQTAITLKFKQEPGVTAENLTASQATALADKNCNVFVSYNNDTAILEEGKMASGEYFDTLTLTDWLATTVQRDVYNALYTSTTKIPQTDEGMGILKAVVEARCAQGVINGGLAPGVWSSNGFGLLKTGDYLQKGYYVYSAPVALQSTANRAARMAQPIQVAVKLAGAIHSSNVTINVNN